MTKRSAHIQGALRKVVARRMTRTLFRLIGFFQKNRTGDDQGLPWQAAIILKAAAIFGPDPTNMTPRALRRGYRLQTLFYHLDDATMGEVADHEIRPDLAVRFYKPEGINRAASALVYFHGGGGVIGDLETHDTLCRHVAREAGLAVLSVAYRLAPEHRVPAQAEDAIAAFNWVHENAGMLRLDPARIGVGGDSAGGLMSFVLATQSLSQTLPGPRAKMPAFLWTLYPSVDQRITTPSRKQFKEGLLLTTPLIDWFTAQARGSDIDPEDPLVSPAVVDSTGLPPTFILTVGFDPLRDEGVAFAERLLREGVALTHRHHPRLPHEFISMAGVVPEARVALDEAIGDLRSMSVPAAERVGDQ